MQRRKGICVIVLDNDRLMRAGLRRLIESRDDLFVGGEAENTDQGVALVRQMQPNVVLLDIEDETSVQQIAEILGVATTCQVLALAEPDQVGLHTKVMLAGARGIFLKDQRPDSLLDAIEKIHLGELWISRSLMDTLLQEVRLPPTVVSPLEMKINSLTAREREVVVMIASGLKNKDIGKRLHITEHTVRHHLTSIYSKLEVTDRLELLIFAYQHSLVPPPSADGKETQASQKTNH